VTARRVSVGIVNHNGESYLLQTLRAVARLGSAVDDVLLIDSGSTDRGPALVGERFPHVRVIELGANLGPGAARNRAIQEAAHDRILLIDNDVEPQPGSVEALSAALDGHAGAILAMAAVLYEHAPDTVQYAGAVPHFLGTTAPYLLQAQGDDHDPFELVPEWSRRARGFPAYAALRSLGRAGVVELVERCCALASSMAAELATEDGIEVLNEVCLNQALVRFGDDDERTREVIRRVQEDGTAWLGGTTWQGRAAMRISVSSHATTEDDAHRTVAAVLAAWRG